MPTLPGPSWLITDPYNGEDPVMDVRTENGQVVWETDHGHGQHSVEMTDVRMVVDRENDGERVMLGRINSQGFEFHEAATMRPSIVYRVAHVLGLPEDATRDQVAAAITDRVRQRM